MTQRDADQPHPIVAAILTGGASRRFGSDKTQARVLGVPSLERVRTALASAGLRAVTVGGQGADIRDRAPLGGPLQALLAALEACEGQDVLLVGADMPRLDPAELESLCAFHRRGTITRTRRRGRVEPLGSIYPSSLLPDFTVAWDSGERSLRRMLEAGPWPIRTWDTSGGGLDDFDTPEELRALEESW